VYFLLKIFSRVVKWQKQSLGAQAQATYFTQLHCGFAALHCKRKHILGLKAKTKTQKFLHQQQLSQFQISSVHGFPFVSNFATTVLRSAVFENSQ
jgi:hypothetical protein